MCVYIYIIIYIYSYPKMLTFMWNDDQPLCLSWASFFFLAIFGRPTGGCGNPHAADHPCSVLYASEQRREHQDDGSRISL